MNKKLTWSLQTIPVLKLEEWKDNPRKISAEDLENLKQSFIEFDQARTITVSPLGKKFEIIGGNQTKKVLTELKYSEIQCSVASRPLTETEKRKLSIYLNHRNKGEGEWDFDVLTGWDDMDFEDIGIEFPEVEIAPATEDDYEAPPIDEIKTDIVLGDLFEIGEHRLLCGDSTDSDAVARLMDGQKADMVFTDPPYGMNLDTDWSDAKSDLQFYKEKGCKGQGNKYDKVIGDNADFKDELISTIFGLFHYCKEIFLWGADYYSDLLLDKNDGSWIVWDKRSNEGTDDDKVAQSDKMYGSCFELCWSKNKHKRDIVRVKWAGIFGTKTEPDKDKSRKHPTQKPVKLAEYFINKFSDKDDNIIDIYAGAGFTMVASHQLNRKCYGMEIEPKYCQIIIDRMLKLDPSLKIKRNGKPYKPISN